MPNPKRVAIYARVSKKEPGRKTAKPNQHPENQLHGLRAFCKTQADWTITHEYVDRASAKSGDRVQFKKLFEDASRREFDLVLFWALDRLSREGTLETLLYLGKLTSWGVNWRSFQESYLDSCGPFADVVISIMATLAKQERIRISERTKAGLQRAVKQGKTLGRPVVAVDLEKVRQLQRQGLSLRSIARETKQSLSTICRALKV